jgi:hypothetical protein
VYIIREARRFRPWLRAVVGAKAVLHTHHRVVLGTGFVKPSKPCEKTSCDLITRFPDRWVKFPAQPSRFPARCLGNSARKDRTLLKDPDH